MEDRSWVLGVKIWAYVRACRYLHCTQALLSGRQARRKKQLFGCLPRLFESDGIKQLDSLTCGAFVPHRLPLDEVLVKY